MHYFLPNKIASEITAACAEDSNSSSSSIVMTPVPASIAVFTGLLNTKLNVSFDSKTWSSTIDTLIDLLSSPGKKVSVPLEYVKSSPAFALKFTVA